MVDIAGANSDLELANNSGLKVGLAPILSFNQPDSKFARVVRASYELTRTVLLESYSWNFSSAFKNIAVSLNVSVHPKYAYAYKLPVDSLDVRSVVGVDDYDWELHSGYIWCDQADYIDINYTRYENDVTEYAALFRQLFVFRFAVVLAAVPGNRQLAADYIAQGEKWEAEAKRIDGTTGNKRRTKRRSGRYRRAAGRRY